MLKGPAHLFQNPVCKSQFLMLLRKNKQKKTLQTIDPKLKREIKDIWSKFLHFF